MDEQLFIEGSPAISGESIADILGLTEYFELIKKKKADD